MPNGTYGGVRRGFNSPYSILEFFCEVIREDLGSLREFVDIRAVCCKIYTVSGSGHIILGRIILHI